MCPIEDVCETDSSKRFKTLVITENPEVYKFRACYSADAIHWNFYDRQWVLCQQNTERKGFRQDADWLRMGGRGLIRLHRRIAQLIGG